MVLEQWLVSLSAALGVMHRWVALPQAWEACFLSHSMHECTSVKKCLMLLYAPVLVCIASWFILR